MQHNNTIEWRFPKDIDQALCDMNHGAATAVAGGTTLLDLIKLGHAMPQRLVDLTRLPLKWIEQHDGIISIGSMSSNSAVAQSDLIRDQFPVLSQAILQGASQQIRNAATVGGNLLQATRCVYFRSPEWRCNRRIPGSGCEAATVQTHSHAVLGGNGNCVAVNPSDMAVALLALDASVITTSLERKNDTIPVADLYRLPGDTPQRTHNIPSRSLITSVEIPVDPAFRNSRYIKLRGRASYEFATVSVAATLKLVGGVVSRVSVALGGVATRPWRRPDAEFGLVGNELNRRTIDDFCDRLLQGEHSTIETRHKIELARGGIQRVLSQLAETNDDGA